MPISGFSFEKAKVKPMCSPFGQESAFELVAASYHRARETGELFDTFYRLFLGKSPEIPPMFARTDFPHQKLMLRESLLEMLTIAQTESGRDEIERLAQRHRQLNVQPRHYVLWLDALCEALAKHDPAFTPQLAQMWRDAMHNGIQVMTAASDSTT
jgi:hemoglobin-like flavoprotein